MSTQSVERCIQVSRFLQKLVDYEIEPGAEFEVELHTPGYVVSDSWGWLPKAATNCENGIILINKRVPPLESLPYIAVCTKFPVLTKS